ncbi:MAG TPA: hypothetical protein VJA94_15435 [Candidatus Angelobacter sp.]
MSALVAEPVVVEEIKAQPTFTIVEDKPETQQSTRVAEPEKEFHPMLVVFIACVVALHLAAAMIGTLTAWIYQLRHSGAFTP